MRNIVRIFRRDIAALRHNVIALIVAVGLVIVPVLYAWFNIAGGWDPYGNTGGMKVAVANADEGYKSDLIPVEVNLGDTVISQLRANDQLDWQFVSEEKAVEGVKSGAYYAAVVIPKDFSADMMTLFSTDVKHSKIIYYENQKASAVSPEVTGQGASTIQRQIDEMFAQTISDVGLSAASGLMDFMNSDQIQSYVSNLSSTLDDGIESLGGAASDMNSFGELLGSTASLLSSTSNLMSETGGTSDKARQTLDDAKQGFSDVKGALSGSTKLVTDALEQSSSSYDAVADAVEDAYAAGSKQATDSSSQLNKIAVRVDERVVAYQKVRDILAELPSTNLVTDTIRLLDRTITRHQALSQKLKDVSKALTDGAADVGDDLAAVKDLIAQAKGSVDAVNDSLEGTLKSQADQLSSTVEGITSSTSGISDDLDATVDGLSAASGSLAGDLGQVQQVLSRAAGTLSDSASRLQTLKSDLDSAAQAGDLQKIRDLIGSDPAALADALAAPVALDKQPVFHIENNGSAMAPFYTTLSLWVGSIVLAAMLKVDVAERTVTALAPVRLHELYLGRFCFFALLSLCQSTLVCAGDILFFGIQCLHPFQFVLAGWLSGLVYCCIVYTLAVSFGDIGKALSVVLLVMQVAGAGGEFPIEMSAPIFQVIYPFLPFTHTMNAMRAAIAGGLGAEFWIELGTVALYLIPALALGLLLRRPVIRLNTWIKEKLEETKLM